MNIRSMLFVFILITGGIAMVDAQIINGLKIKKEGHIEIDSMRIGVQLFDDAWSAVDQSADTITFDAGYPKMEAASYELKGTFKHKNGGTFKLSERIAKAGETSMSYVADMKSPGFSANSLALSINIPADEIKGKAVVIDGKPVLMPLTLGETAVFTGESKKMVIPLSTGKLFFEGAVKLMIQDSRKWGNNFEVRIYFSASAGVIKESSIKLNIGYESFDSTTIDIRPYANMGFRDEVDGDKKGGWTDQGSENDLAGLKPGRQIFGGLTFDVIDPAKNSGKSCLLFAGPDRGYFLKDVSIKTGGSYEYIYLLHAIAWPPNGKAEIGSVKVSYKDGSSTVKAIVNAVDVANWWAPDDYSNAMVAWTTTNKSTFVGLYITKIKVERKEIASIELVPNGKAVWGVVGITASMDNIPMASSSPTYIAVSPKWQPVSRMPGIAKGSVLDSSSLISHAPAGKYGDVIIRNGHFELKDKPGEKIKFFGPNVCFTANYLEKPEAEALADLFVRMGYNTIRFHHYDGDFVDKNAADSYTMNAANVDKIDYLFHCMKQRGIYVTIDLFTVRRTKAGEIPEIGNRSAEMTEYKALVKLVPSALENWKKYAAIVLTHKNPYTGLAWKDDPALYSINVLNEDNLYHTWQTTPEVKAIALKLFDGWCAKNGIVIKDEAERPKLIVRFLTETEIGAYRQMRDYLKGMSTKALLTDNNFIGTIALAKFRGEELDFVDDHGYWDHMSFLEKQWSRPWKFHNKSVIGERAALPRGNFGTRILGKPFTFTEFNYVAPNDYRSEGGPVFGAYAALQDWDGIYRFAYSHNRQNIVESNRAGAAGGFDIAIDPINFLSEKIAALFFLRGDVKRATTEIPFVVNNSYIEGEGLTPNASFPSDFTTLGLMVRIGSSFIKDNTLPKTAAAVVSVQESLKAKGAKLPDGELLPALISGGVIPAALYDADKKRYRSETGEIMLNATEGTFSVATAKSEAMVLPEGKTAQTGVLSVTNEEHFGTFFAAAVDGSKLADSSRILFVHLTDAKNNKMRFRNKARTIEETAGEWPVLVAYGKAKVTLAVKKKLKVFGCDIDGTRIAEVPSTTGANGISFTAETGSGGKMKYMVYELAEK
ncbi:MAG: hypothetical protein HZC28_18805 [Spirochaetes bacterium]|nr:hypothetical protein [Spirochaetota bacterium]